MQKQFVKNSERTRLMSNFKNLTMENTLENKEKFFAQYYGQEVANIQHPFDEDYMGQVDGLFIGGINFLELKSISSITDEDAIEIDRMFYDFVNHEGNAIIGKNLIFSSPDISRLPSVVVDYLRSKSYALPWMGVSVEDLVNFGWVKLKEN